MSDFQVNRPDTEALLFFSQKPVFLSTYYLKYLDSFNVKSFSSLVNPRKRTTGQITEWEKEFAPFGKLPHVLNIQAARKHKKRHLKSSVTRDIILDPNKQNGPTLLIRYQLVCYFWKILPSTKGSLLDIYTTDVSSLLKI